MATPKELPNIKFLRESFYVVDGILYWKERPASHFSTESHCRVFNAKFANKPCSQQISASARYLKVRLPCGVVPQHRVILSLYLDRVLLTSELVDHMDGDVLNNRFENLRIADYKLNSRNQKTHVTNKSGASGVYLLKNKDGSLYARAQWYEDGKRVNKSFSFTKYGIEVAFALATEEIEKARNRIGGFTERHGKKEHVDLAKLIADQICRTFDVSSAVEQ